MPRALAFAFAALSVAMAGALVGCSPAIGDKCALSTDCSVQGTRFCDVSQPGGYCTLLHCTADKCPENAVCVEFGASIAGCGYDDYHAPSPAGRAMCMKACASNSDCRESDGYACVSPIDPRTNLGNSAVILDGDHQQQSVCMLVRSVAPSTDVDAAVCSPLKPDVPSLEASVSPGTGGEAGPNGIDAGRDASGDDAAESGSADVSGGDSNGEGPVEGGAEASGGDAGEDGLVETGAEASGGDGGEVGSVEAGSSFDATADSGVPDALGGS